jgi:hypothetical protein
MAANLALSNKQFSDAPHLAALHSSMTRAGYTTSSRTGAGVAKANKMPYGMEAYRRNLKIAAAGSATSSHHSLGAALNESGGSMYDVPAAPKKNSRMSNMRTKVTEGLGKLASSAGREPNSGGSQRGSQNHGKSKKTVHAKNSGNNARVLKAVTGVK